MEMFKDPNEIVTEIVGKSELVFDLTHWCNKPIICICLSHGSFCCNSWYTLHENCSEVIKILKTDRIFADLKFAVDIYHDITWNIVNCLNKSDFKGIYNCANKLLSILLFDTLFWEKAVTGLRSWDVLLKIFIYTF